MKTNLVTTIGGILALFGGIPIALGTAHVAMPGWLYLFCIVCGVLGPGIIGIAAKDAKGSEPPPPAPPTDPKPPTP